MTDRNSLARRRLDERLEPLRTLNLTPPPRGWLRAVRESLGLTTAQFAARLGMRQPSVIDLEKSEAEGRVTLATLRRAAEAVNCSLVYALVPTSELEDIVAKAALAAARREVTTSLHTMGLEGQSPRAADQEDMVARLAAEIAAAGGRRLWGRTGTGS